MRLSRLAAALLVSGVAAALVFPPLGQRVIATSDEARFALLARDVVERGVLFDLEVRGRQYRNKPPLYPWTIAAFSLAVGRVTEATAHAPVALAAVGAVLFVFLLGDRLFGRRAGLWAGLILATGYGFFGHSQLRLPDMLVVSCAAMAGYAFWLSRVEPASRWALPAFYAALALGFFAKGPVGLLPLLVAAVWLGTESGRRRLGQLWSPGGLALFALITSTWLLPFLLLGARSFAGDVLWQNWLAWYFGRPSPDRLANLAIDLVMGFMPWTVVAPLALGAAARARRAPGVRFALLWFVVPFVVVLLSANQRTRYLLPLYPGLALLVGWWADAHGPARAPAARLFGWIALGLGAATVLAADAPQWFEPAQRPYVPGYTWEALPLLLGAALAAVAMWGGLRTGRPAVLVHGVAAGMIVILGYGIWPYNSRFNRIWDFPALAASVGQHAGAGPAAVFGGRWFPLDFYLGRPLQRVGSVAEANAFLARPERPVLVMRSSLRQTILGDLSTEARVFGERSIGTRPMVILRSGRVPTAGGRDP